jgi:hypothetical protein
MARRPIITYPTGRLLAVIDQPDRAQQAAQALIADGIAEGDVTVLAGPADRERLGRVGPRSSSGSRIVRVFQFLLMDQLPDFLVYERALDSGRAVVAVRVTDRATMLRVQARLEGFGAHFLNHFGRLFTEELSRWRGEEPDIPNVLRR